MTQNLCAVWSVCVFSLLQGNYNIKATQPFYTGKLNLNLLLYVTVVYQNERKITLNSFISGAGRGQGNNQTYSHELQLIILASAANSVKVRIQKLIQDFVTTQQAEGIPEEETDLECFDKIIYVYTKKG